MAVKQPGQFNNVVNAIMCDRAVVLIAGREPVWCGSQGELARALHMLVKRLPLERGYRDASRRANVCLCPIDFRKLARLRGLIARQLRDDGHFGEWELRR